MRFSILSIIKKTVKNILICLRKIDCEGRPFPDFIIVGAQKSGTTSLYDYLSFHPDLCPSYEKEVHYFDGGLDPEVDNFDKGPMWYKANFPKRKSTRSKFFEASPLYLFNPLAPKRIYNLVPRAKIVMVLRDPTERAISHYFHELRKGYETLPIMEALTIEEKRLKPSFDSQNFKSDDFIHCSYKSRGLYLNQIESYREFFEDNDILIINSKDLFECPNETLESVFEFVGVDSSFVVPDLSPSNPGKNRVDVDDEVYEYLNVFFDSSNEALEKFLDNDFRK